MHTVILVTADPVLQDIARRMSLAAPDTLRIAGDRATLHAALAAPARRVLFDLNVCQAPDALECVREIKQRAAGVQLIVFLDHLTGDLPVRAKLAGADRIVPRSQLDRELAALLTP